MALWRAQTKRIAITALLALVIQFAGTLGHFHHDWFDSSETAASAASDHHSPGNQDHDHGKSGGLCSICTAASIAHAFVSADAPLLLLPSRIAIELKSIDREVVFSNDRRSAFHSRAPPLV